ncbi:unnamed protein product, partial [Sphagnum jensenii]
MKLDCCSLDVVYEEESAVLLLKRSLCCCCYWTTQEAGLRNLRLKSVAAAMQHSSSMPVSTQMTTSVALSRMQTTLLRHQLAAY